MPFKVYLNSHTTGTYFGTVLSMSDNLEQKVQAEIAFTPTIYINGYQLPEKYRVDELKYIL